MNEPEVRVLLPDLPIEYTWNDWSAPAVPTDVTPDVPELPQQNSVEAISVYSLSPRDRFVAGYRDRAGGDSRLLDVLDHVVDKVIP